MKNRISVKQYLTMFPTASTAEVVRHTGVRPNSVHTARSLLRMEGIECVPRKLKQGRPPKVQDKAAEVIHVTTSNTSVNDPVNKPSHYLVGGIETIDFIEAKKLGYNLGNAVKYITRADHKRNRLEDLNKAVWYLTREIQNATASK